MCLPRPRYADAFELFLCAFEKQLVKALLFDLGGGESENECKQRQQVTSFARESPVFDFGIEKKIFFKKNFF